MRICCHENKNQITNNLLCNNWKTGKTENPYQKKKKNQSQVFFFWILNSHDTDSFLFFFLFFEYIYYFPLPNNPSSPPPPIHKHTKHIFLKNYGCKNIIFVGFGFSCALVGLVGYKYTIRKVTSYAVSDEMRV